jgi:hypothetical protein
MKIRIALALTVLLAACGGEAPTGAEPAGPSFDNYVIGSGNRADTTATQNSTPPTTPETSGTYVIGSGN